MIIQPNYIYGLQQKNSNLNVNSIKPALKFSETSAAKNLLPNIPNNYFSFITFTGNKVKAVDGDENKFSQLSKEYLASAKNCLKDKNYLWSILISHQAVECALRANFIKQTGYYRDSHELINVACEQKIPCTAFEKKFLRCLNEYYLGLKYPKNKAIVDNICKEDRAQKIVKAAENFIKLIETGERNPDEKMKMNDVTLISELGIDEENKSFNEEAILAESHLKTAKDCLKNKDYAWTIVTCEQALEAVLIAIRMKNFGDYGCLAHNIKTKAELAGALTNKFSQDQTSLIENIGKLYSTARYPKDLKEKEEICNEDNARKILKNTEELFVIFKDMLNAPNNKINVSFTSKLLHSLCA